MLAACHFCLAQWCLTGSADGTQFIEELRKDGVGSVRHVAAGVNSAAGACILHQPADCLSALSVMAGKRVDAICYSNVVYRAAVRLRSDIRAADYC